MSRRMLEMQQEIKASTSAAVKKPKSYGGVLNKSFSQSLL
jgi:hypothetical protein